MSEAEAPKFEDDLLKERSESEQLMLYLGDFDGPIDMLLSLARDQKVDLAKISILALANQYIDFIEKARALRLELAADYLVMAAWLAYLKSRLLIPQEEKKQAEPSAQDLAEALQFQLRRLEAMRQVANDLFHLPRLGYNVFSRGEPEGLKTDYIPRYEMTFYDLLRAYGDIRQRQQNAIYKLNPVKLFSLEDAIERMEQMLGKIPQEWVSLFMFLPGGAKEKIVHRSAVASTFGGALEMAKRGLLQIQQERNYGPIYIRRPDQDGEASASVPQPPQAAEETGISAEDIAFAERDLAEELAEEQAREAARRAAEQALAEAANPSLRPAVADGDEAEDEAAGDAEPDVLDTAALEPADAVPLPEESFADEQAAPADQDAPRAMTEEEEWEALLAEEAAAEEAKRRAAQAAQDPEGDPAVRAGTEQDTDKQGA